MKPTIGIGSIYQTKSKVWYFEYRKLGLRKSLNTTDENEALQNARSEFGYLAVGKKESQLQEISQRIQLETNKSGLSGIALDAKVILDYYLEQMSRSNVSKLHITASSKSPMSKNYLQNTQTALNVFVKWIHDNYPSVKTMAQVSPLVADNYFAYIRTCKSAHTYNNWLSILRQIFKKLAIKSCMQSNPFDFVDQLNFSTVKAEGTSWQPFTDEELNRIENECTSWIPAAVEISRQTALRLSDVCCVKLTDIRSDGYITNTNRKTGKTLVLEFTKRDKVEQWIKSEERLQEIHDLVLADFVFPKLADVFLELTPQHRSRNIPSQQFHSQVKALKIQLSEKPDNHGKTIRGFHSIRSFRATQLYNQTGTVSAASKELGHSSQQTTNGYIHTTVEDQIRLLQSSPSVEKLAEYIKVLSVDDKSKLLKLILS